MSAKAAASVNPIVGPYNEQLQKRLAGTKWANYRIIGWQYEVVNEKKEPTTLANMAIETYFSATSSCMSCHELANIGPPKRLRFNMWNIQGGIYGRVGEVDFQAIAKKQFPTLTFKPMDHVWSLREAYPKAGSSLLKNSAYPPK